MTFPDEHAPSKMGRILLIVPAGVLALVLPFVVASQVFDNEDPGARQLTRSSSAPSGTPTSAVTSAGPTATATPTSTPAAAATSSPALMADAEACRLANLRQQSPLSAADVSLAQFDKHIDAMNLLVAGKISLSVATTFWDETRVKAMENAAAFRSADKELRASATTCRVPDPAVANAAPYGQVVAIKSCASAIKARSAALARSRTAVTTWEHHVHDMELLRTGKLTPAQATVAWKRDWKTGEKQLVAFEKAAAQAKKVACSLD